MSNSMAINDFSTRFTQFVKEKQLTFVFPTNPDTLCGEEYNNRSTMNLFPVKQGGESNNGSIGRTINLFPQFSGFNSSGKKRASPEPEAAQMTIFYGGQVVTFNDLPADKANEVMNLARGFESSLKTRKVETQASPVPIPLPISNPQPTVVNPNSSPNQSRSLGMGIPNFGKRAATPGVSMPISDLPIARKASLHRFLEKRKDRLVGKAPQSTNVLEGATTKPLEGQLWLGLNSVPVFQQKQQQRH